MKITKQSALPLTVEACLIRLMLPKKLLSHLGQNMWDHIAFSPAYAVNLITYNSLAVPEFAAEQTENYINNRTGMLINCGGGILD